MSWPETPVDRPDHRRLADDETPTPGDFQACERCAWKPPPNYPGNTCKRCFGTIYWWRPRANEQTNAED